MSDTIAEDLRRLTDYVAGELSADEIAVVEAWIAEDDARRALVDYLRGTQAALRAAPARIVDSDRVRQGVMARLHTPPLQPAQPALAPPLRRLHVSPHLSAGRTARSIAAFGAVVAVVLGVMLLRPSAKPVPPAVGQEFVTAAGQHSIIPLPDGSRVHLAPQSRLRILDGFARTSRTLQITGQAYFDVATVAGLPFVVHAGSVTTRVLGTAFEVRHYSTDRDVRITVVSGKVSAGGKRAPLTLTAGAIGWFGDAADSSAISQNVSTNTAWVDGRIEFDNEAVPVVLATLGRWYRYDFRLADSALATQHLSGVFKTSSPDEAMRALKELLNVTLSFDDSVVTLRPRTRGDVRPALPRSRRGVFSPSVEVGR